MKFFQKNLKDKFTKVYLKNYFKGSESKSGEGSSLLQTKVIRDQIPLLLKEFSITSFIDAPCGDWNWMSMVDFGECQYTGVDIVEQLVQENIKKYKKENLVFLHKDLTQESLAYADLIFSRDCFVHLGYVDIFKILNKFKASGAKYLLTTTFVERDLNVDLKASFWRPLNLQKSPFNFPEPLKLINENCTEAGGKFNHKCLGLWRLNDLSFEHKF